MLVEKTLDALPLMALLVKAVVAGPAMLAVIAGIETAEPPGTMLSKETVAVAGNGPGRGQLNGGVVERSSQIKRDTPLNVTDGK